ncbi:ABC transporter permease [Domibacillus sp. DTU_2020_1001157_1_SI_ALB_TIR_016]|uniref:ABC transporter permease n=1 Tax=Domibacillus sp. DTU_2020_1001157_1_SI_ALB_TIR_016 TaxID=3077789 RepID=UPI0028E85F3F|nr:ABC transporter permease [Domibacillus sp. DTU_2020_1001157_1_SI_ALB_TIR_016]WNS79074.1 ABC transporter permease [Domibacillus sp. DTU_2020_1001157_1_SI_ALB_TIR_016]
MNSILKSKEVSIAMIVILLSIVLTFISPVFLTADNLLDVIKGNAVLGILAIGMTMVIITGGIDVSVAAVTSAVCVILGKIMVIMPDSPVSILLLFLIGPLLGIILGAINGVLVAKIQIPAIVVTLGMMSIINGLVLYITNGQYLNSSSFPSIFLKFSSFEVFGISIVILMFIAVALLTWYLLKYTLIGREVMAIGGNKDSAVRVGINFDKVQIFVFSYMGFLAGIAAIAQTAYTKAVDPNGMLGLELMVIAAVVLGGANIMGGRGTVMGTVLGVLLLGIVQNGLILARIDTFWQKVFTGIIILLAVSYDHVQYKRSQEKLSKIEVEA